MTYKKLIFSGLIVFFTLFAEAKPPELTPHLTYKKSEEIFKGHVTYKELSPEIARRTLQNYINELDPTKTYFLADEVAQWENPSDELIDELIRNYKKENFTHFETIYQIMIRAPPARSGAGTAIGRPIVRLAWKKCCYGDNPTGSLQISREVVSSTQRPNLRTEYH